MPKSPSPIPWMGSKRRLAPTILERMPEHTCYVELFAGSAAVLFARPEPAKVEVVNDLDGELINLFRILKHHLVEFVQQFRWSITSRQMWKWLDDTPPETLTDIQRAARFYYLHRLGFGGKAVGRTFGYSPTAAPRINFVRIEEALSDVHQRLAQVLVEQLPWQDCVRRYDRPGTLFFCDPPYLGLAGYVGKKWELEDFEELATVLGSIQGKALLTVNDHPDLRRVFGAFAFDHLETRYTVGSLQGKTKPASELLFRTWEKS